MTIEAEDKRFNSLRTGLWVVGALVAVGLIAGAFHFNRLENAINALSSEVGKVKAEVDDFKPFAAQDTPVVLLGGSVNLQAIKTTWQPDPAVTGGYYASGQDPTGAISIKNPGGTEFGRIMTNGQSWVVTVVSDQVNAITISQAANDPKISVAPVAGAGTLNLPTATPPNNTKLHYHKHGMSCSGGGEDCDHLQTFSITVNNIPMGVFNCTDAPSTSTHGNSGHCRVEFVEK